MLTNFSQAHFVDFGRLRQGFGYKSKKRAADMQPFFILVSQLAFLVMRIFSKSVSGDLKRHDIEFHHIIAVPKLKDISARINFIHVDCVIISVFSCTNKIAVLDM